MAVWSSGAVVNGISAIVASVMYGATYEPGTGCKHACALNMDSQTPEQWEMSSVDNHSAGFWDLVLAVQAD